jgi:hypothetical protein
VAPPRVAPQGMAGDIPIFVGTRGHSLGMRAGSRRTGYFVRRSRALADRYLGRYPATDEGWQLAWEKFRQVDPEGAAAAARAAREKAATTAGGAAAGPDELPAQPALAMLPGCLLVGGYSRQPGRLALYTGYDLHFADDALLVAPSGSAAAHARFGYADLGEVTVQGPVTVRDPGGRPVAGTVVEMRGGPEQMVWTTLADPEQVRQLLLPVQRRLASATGSATGTEPSATDTGPGQSGAEHPVDRLEQLARLRRQGALTETEYQAAKTAVMAELTASPARSTRSGQTGRKPATARRPRTVKNRRSGGEDGEAR